MKSYVSKQELLDTIKNSASKFLAEFDDVTGQNFHRLVPSVEKTPFQMMAYQYGWLQTVMTWEQDELSGREAVMPAAGFKCNRLSALYASFYDRYAGWNQPRLTEEFNRLLQQWCQWIESLCEEDLFQQGHRRWTGDKPHWPLARWIHINSMAPFGTFRSQIRKWKRCHSGVL